ncbi:hypothetical protein ACWCYZ_16690 [Streptomyces virginiae]
MKRSDLTTTTLLTAIEAHGPGAFAVLTVGYPPKVVHAAYDRDLRRGLLECGVSLRTAWLSPSGRWYLARKRGTPPCCTS